MNLLGREGIVEFRRPTGVPVVLPVNSLDKTLNTFLVESEDFWPGDQVKVYGRNSAGVVIKTGYYSRDQIGKASLYATQAEALSGLSAGRLSLADFGSFPLLLAHDTVASHAISLSNAITVISYDTTIDKTKEFPLNILNSLYEAYEKTGPQYLDWTIQAQIRSWQFSINSSPVDTTAISEIYASSIKSFIGGSGSLDFLVSSFARPGETDASALLRFVLLVEKGGTCRARFYMKQDTGPVFRIKDSTAQSTSSLFYEAEIYFLGSSVDVSADGLIAGSADFVTQGRIRLGIAKPEDPYIDAETVQGDLALFYFGVGETDTWFTTGMFNTHLIDRNGDYYSANSARTFAERNSAVAQAPSGASMVKFQAQGASWPTWVNRYTVNDDYIYYRTNVLTAFDQNENIWILFTKYNSGLNRNKICFAKLDKATGAVLSSFAIKTEILLSLQSLVSPVKCFSIDDEGNFYLGIQFNNSSGTGQTAVVKVNQDGSIGWTRKIYTNTPQGANYPLKIIIRGNRVTVGIRHTPDGFGTFFRGATYVVFSKTGQTIVGAKQYEAVHAYAGNLINRAMLIDFEIAADGSIYGLYNYRNLGADDDAIYIYKLTAEFTPIWCYAYIPGPMAIGSTSISNGITGNDIRIDKDGRIFILGRSMNHSIAEIIPCRSTSGEGRRGTTIMEIDQSGNLLSVRSFALNSRAQVGATDIYSTVPSFADTLPNVDYDIMPVRINSGRVTGEDFSESRLMVRKQGQLGTWGLPCLERSSSSGDIALTVVAFAGARSAALYIGEQQSQAIIEADNFLVETDDSYVLQESFSLHVAVKGHPIPQ